MGDRLKDEDSRTFKRDKDGIAAVVDSIQYDPNRTARIALLKYEDGEKRYIVAPNGLQVGQTVLSGTKIDPEIADRAAILANIKKQIAIAKVNAQRAATIEAQKKIGEVN